MALKLSAGKFEILKGVEKFDLIDLFKELWENGWEEHYNNFLKIKSSNAEAFMLSLHAFLKVKIDYKSKVSEILNPRGISDLDLRLGILGGQRYNQFANEVAVVLRLSSVEIDDIISIVNGKNEVAEESDISFTQNGLKKLWDSGLKDVFEEELKNVRFGNFVAINYSFLVALEKTGKQQILDLFKTSQKNKSLFGKLLRKFGFRGNKDGQVSVKEVLTFLEGLDYYNNWLTYVKRKNTRKNNITINGSKLKIYSSRRKDLKGNS